jgi:hypothetical protein
MACAVSRQDQNVEILTRNFFGCVTGDGQTEELVIAALTKVLNDAARIWLITNQKDVHQLSSGTIVIAVMLGPYSIPIC